VAPAPAPSGDALSLEEVVASAVRAHPLVEVARQDAVAAEGELLAARGGFDPEVKAKAAAFPYAPYEYGRAETTVTQPTPLWGTSLFGGWRYGRGDIPAYYGGYETLSLGELRAGVSVPLWRNGPVDRRRAGITRAELGQEAAALSVAQSRLDAARAAAQRYWDWVAAGRRLEVARALLELARVRDAQLAERVRRGDVPEFERTDNRRALVQRQGAVVTAERGLQQAAIELSLFLRDADGAPLMPPPGRLPPSLPEPPPTAAVVGGLDVSAILARRPDVQRLSAQLAQQRVEARLADNQAAPQVDVLLAVAKDVGSGDAKLGKTEVELGLSVDLPTLNRAALGRQRVVNASAAKLDAQLQLQRERAVADVRDGLSALETARERVALARQEASVAHLLEEGERTRFQAGDSSLLFVTLREQTAAEAEVRVVDALAEFHKAAAALRVALALPVTGPVTGPETGPETGPVTGPETGEPGADAPEAGGG
jgi:outer membrane protein TolC